MHWQQSRSVGSLGTCACMLRGWLYAHLHTHMLVVADLPITVCARDREPRSKESTSIIHVTASSCPQAKLAALQISYDTSVNEKNRLREESEALEAKLDR